MSRTQQALTAALALLFGFIVAAGSVLLGYPMLYRNRVYPGVTVRGADLGGLPVQEATSLLCTTLPSPATQVVELRAGERAWQFAWAEAGQAYDCGRTASSAHEIGRRGKWYERLMAPWLIRLHGHSLEPRLQPAEATQVRAALEDLASEVAVPPMDAQLQISTDGIDAVPKLDVRPGEPGTRLEVAASVALMLQELADGATEIELVTVSVPPRLLEPEPAHSLARSLLAETVTLVVDDPLTDYRAEFEAPPGQVASWLRVFPAADEILLRVDESAVQDWLLDLGYELGPERELAADETLTRALAALGAGERRIDSVVRHPERKYLVKSGDTLFDIAYRYGFPQWRLEEANPDVEPHELFIGMELTIPSIDVLFPEPLVPGKRIEIDLSEQRLRAYDNDELVYDFASSTGLPSTPTIPGQFQVLFKEPQAYAQRWSLEMPYFLAIYYERPGFVNGIHELPINAAGERLWASVLGRPASYGCIILDVGDAEKLYRWAPVGTLVRITGGAPGTTVQSSSPEGVAE